MPTPLAPLATPLIDFSQDALKEAIQKALNLSDAIPKGQRGAFITAIDETGAKAAIASRLGDGSWQVDAYVEHPWAGGLDYGINLHDSW